MNYGMNNEAKVGERAIAEWKEAMSAVSPGGTANNQLKQQTNQ